jgi:hypothetical protein
MFRLTRDECQAAIDRTHRAASDLAARLAALGVAPFAPIPMQDFDIHIQ